MTTLLPSSNSTIRDTMPVVPTQPLKGPEVASKQLAGDLQSFLKILTVQMQQQDPFNPTDSSEFVAQLVQFANVEQSINHNKKLDSLIEIQKTQQAVQAINFIGKTVKYQGNQMYYDGKNPAPVTINLPQDVPNLNYTIFDAKGRFVLSETVSAAAGPYVFDFGNGTDKNNKAIPAGAYRIEVKALDKERMPLKDNKNNPISLPILLQGKVTTVEKVNHDPVLNIENVAVPFDTIDSFSDMNAPEFHRFDPSNLEHAVEKTDTELPIYSLPLAMEEAMK